MVTGGLLRLGVGGISYASKVLTQAPIAYWPLWESTGSVAHCLVNSAQNGTYTGVTLGQQGIGDGRTSPLFDGANDYVNIYTTTFRDAFDGAEGSILAWIKVFDVGVWTDTEVRRTVNLRSDTNNQLFCFGRSAANNALLAYYKAGGTVNQRSKASVSDLGWICVGLTWSKTADKMIPYYQGAPDGPTQTSLGTWVGNLLSTRTCIGAAITTPGSPWHGWLAHCAVWDNPLSAATMSKLATV